MYKYVLQADRGEATIKSLFGSAVAVAFAKDEDKTITHIERLQAAKMKKISSIATWSENLQL